MSTKKPQSSTIKAVGIGGVLVGVPIGGYLGSLTMGVIKVATPETFEALKEIPSVANALSGLYTVGIAYLIGLKKKEVVMK